MQIHICKEHTFRLGKKLILFVAYHTLSHYHTISVDIIPYRTILYHVIPYHTISYHTIPYHIISYHIISYHIISYHTISHHSIQYIPCTPCTMIPHISCMFLALACNPPSPMVWSWVTCGTRSFCKNCVGRIWGHDRKCSARKTRKRFDERGGWICSISVSMGATPRPNRRIAVLLRIFCTSDPVQIFLLRRSFLDLISFSGTVSIYVSGVSLCQDKYTNASDPVVTREQRMKEQAWHYFAAVNEVMLYVFAGWKVEAGQWFKSNKQLDLQTVKLLLL